TLELLARVVWLLLVFQAFFRAFYQAFFLVLRRDVGGVLGHAIGRCGVSGLARGIEPASFLAVFAHVISLPGFRVGSCRVRHHPTMLGLGHDYSLFPRYRLVWGPPRLATVIRSGSGAALACACS